MTKPSDSDPAGQPRVEIRVSVPRPLAAALDMIAQARGLTVTGLVIRVLTLFVVRKQHEASLIARTAAVTPVPPDSDWGGLE